VVNKEPIRISLSDHRRICVAQFRQRLKQLGGRGMVLKRPLRWLVWNLFGTCLELFQQQQEMLSKHLVLGHSLTEYMSPPNFASRALMFSLNNPITEDSNELFI
jgi:hypothetical protein